VSGYTPVFDTVLEGTLCGKWPHTGVWLCLLSQCDYRGYIDQVPELLAIKMGIPLADLLTCIRDFTQPDARSRSPESEGRRLVPIDDARDWGWRVVNVGLYRKRAAGHDQIEDGRNAKKCRKYRAAKTSTPTDTARHSPTGTHTHTHTHTQTHTQTETKTPLPPCAGLDLEAWQAWETYRSKIRKPLRPISIASAQRELAKHGDLQSAVVEQSIANGWTGIFELKSSGAPGWRDKPYVKAPSADELEAEERARAG
jgi:hypothetical protein